MSLPPPNNEMKNQRFGDDENQEWVYLQHGENIDGVDCHRQKTSNLLLESEPFPSQNCNEEEEELSDGQKRALFIWLIISTVINISLCLASLGLCLMSVMFFDSGVTVGALFAVGLVLCIPVLIVGTIINSWRAYRSQNYRLVILLNLFPTLIAMTYILALLAS